MPVSTDRSAHACRVLPTLRTMTTGYSYLEWESPCPPPGTPRHIHREGELKMTC
jgi:hypothetical protein